MYEYLSGTISELAPTHAVLDVGGVGYFLQISLQTYSEIEHSLMHSLILTNLY